MIASVLVLTTAALVQLPGDSTRILGAHRVAAGEQVPVIDGRLDDAVWSAAPVAGGFIQQRPNPGQPATQRTEARVAYDKDAVYVAVRAFDSAPDSITAQLGRRDATGLASDWVHVVFDSYHDKRTGFRFAVTPRGVKRDVFHYDDGPEDGTWDAVWTVETQIDSAGWTAEFRIPLSQLRFRSTAGEQTWGLNVARDLARKEERSYWAPMLPNQSGFASRFGTLTGLSGLSSPRRLEVLPYTVGRVTRDGRVSGDDPFRSPTDPSFSAGADLEYGLTSNLTLTATFNPDFGQVEADPSQVNLSAFEQFFSERRPFFVEGIDVFNFGLGGQEALFYPRRIGRRPQGGLSEQARFVDAPETSTILGAAKMTGRMPGGWTVGILDAVTAEEKTRFVGMDEGGIRERVTEPMTNYAVARVRRDMRGGQSSVGLMGTMVHRRLGGRRGLAFLPGSAYTGGLDWRHRFLNGSWQFHGFFLQSDVRGDTVAIQRLQRSSSRLFQRPDADHVEYDPTRTALNGSGGLMAINKIAGTWRTGVGLIYRSPGLDVNDIGFLQTADAIWLDTYVGYNEFQPRGAFRSYSAFVGMDAGFTNGGDHTGYGTSLSGNFTLKSLWAGYANVKHSTAGLSVSQLRGGPALATQPASSFNAGVSSDKRKQISAGVDVAGWLAHGSDGSTATIAPYINIRPSSRFDLSLSPRLALNNSAGDYVTTRSDRNAGSATEYVFARLDQTTTSLTARLNYIFTPTLSLQYYAQPFISAGDYNGFMEVENPRERRFGNRFRALAPSEIRQCANADGSVYFGVRPLNAGCGDGAGFGYRISNPDFNVRRFNSNAVVRWEYRPGSTLFVVWSQGRAETTADGRYRFRENTSDLFRAPGTNVLLIKMSYWLDL
jgi:hypothetical protein